MASFGAGQKVPGFVRRFTQLANGFVRRPTRLLAFVRRLIQLAHDFVRRDGPWLRSARLASFGAAPASPATGH
jgi:hypothetical protein